MGTNDFERIVKPKFCEILLQGFVHFHLELCAKEEISGTPTTILAKDIIVEPIKDAIEQALTLAYSNIQ